MNLWIVGQYKSGEVPDIVWEFQGVFDTKEKAMAACRNRNYFIAPEKLNEEIGDETIIREDHEYPLAESNEQVV